MTEIMDSPSHGSHPTSPRHSPGYQVSRIFGCRTFSGRVLQERLSPASYERLMASVRQGEKLDEETADIVAQAMKDWATENGATHYCHWFQPMTGLTAEKHDSFLDLEDGLPIERFSGRNLIQGEPDASSFPSGGLRTTFEARGYTGWDPSSPAFLMNGPLASTLCIPTVFTTYHGQAMDKKTPLLRSMRNLSASATRLLELFAQSGHRESAGDWVTATVGCEQEYFLVQRDDYRRRPDLVQAGRTLIGAPPAKGQQLEDHYFGSIHQRVQAFMQDVELELYELGVPCKTRHNEVAPSQFETAPIFEDANIAADHNFLTMEVMRRVADRHGLALLLHEKPFAGINGSGKHCNWAMADADGRNLLEPGDTPESNLQFLAFFCATLEAVYRRADLLRAAIASSGNDHRLGANEAPPAILSVFIGDSLTNVLDRLAEGTTLDSMPQKTVELGIDLLPEILAHNTDRNRTSPFAFTGNKFEFRAVGSSRPISTPIAYLNAAVAEALDLMSERIRKGLEGGKDFQSALNAALRESIEISRPVRFEGNNYSEEWRLEAEARGLSNLRDTAAALEVLRRPETIEFLERAEVLTRDELEARYHTQLGRYVTSIEIECDVLLDLTRTMVLPAAFEYQRTLAESLTAARGSVPEEVLAPQVGVLTALSETIARTITAVGTLSERSDAVAQIKDIAAHAAACANELRTALDALRECCDSLEEQVDSPLWRLPKYRDLLYSL